MTRIFISYRRQDSGTFTGRIHDQLKASFGVSNVFRDVYNIPAGSDFRSVLSKEVGKCDIFLAIIGPHWVNITDSSGNRRLDEPNDFVRIEVESALKNPKTLVVPVLVDNASMPTAEELPANLKELAYRNAVKVRTDPDFPHDMEVLVRQLKHSKPRPISHALWPVLVAILLLFAGLVLFPGFKNVLTAIPAITDKATAIEPLLFTATAQAKNTLEIVETATPASLVEHVGDGEILVVVAQIEQTGSENRDITRTIINDLGQRFEVELPMANIQNIRIREYKDVIKSKEEASQIAEQTQAVILIWGDYDNDAARITVQLGSLASRPDLLIDREILDRTVTVRVKMIDEHEETLAYPVLTILSFLHSSENNFVETIRLFMAFDLLDAVSPEMTGNTVAAHVHKASQAFLSEKEYAIAETEQAIKLDANNPLLYMFRALLCQETGDFLQSNLDLDFALLRAPKGWIMPYHIKGAESLILNDPQKGIEAYSNIIEVKPNDWLPYNQRGYLYMLAGQYELALGNIEKSTQIYELARQDIKKSIELEPDAEWPYMWATLIALRQGRVNDIPALMQHISQSKQSDFIKNLMTTMYGEEKATLLGASMSTMEQLSKRQFLYAIGNADAVLTAMPTYAEMHLLKGLSYCNLGDYQNAESAYTQGLKIDPSFTVLHLLRAEVRSKTGNSSGVTEDEEFVQDNDLKNYLSSAKLGLSPCKQLVPPPK